MRSVCDQDLPLMLKGAEQRVEHTLTHSHTFAWLILQQDPKVTLMLRSAQNFLSGF